MDLSITEFGTHLDAMLDEIMQLVASARPSVRPFGWTEHCFKGQRSGSRSKVRVKVKVWCLAVSIRSSVLSLPV